MADLSLESELIKSEHTHLIAGLDEAGRGALAGPVVAAAVILPLHDKKKLKKLKAVNDSKQLSAAKRNSFYDLILENALCWGVYATPAKVIDEIGILPSTRKAMRESLTQLSPSAEFLLIDGRIRLKTIPTRQRSVIRGDGISLSIAAASIIAKVTRDRMMIQFANSYPTYKFDGHKGYGTQFHRDMIAAVGPCDIHRHTFEPIKSLSASLSLNI
ncbi:MAG: ribonuclease HII [Anaerolineae bacterium]